MKVTLHTQKDLNTFIGTNEKGKTIEIGLGERVGPMESVLMAVAGCSTIDIVMILKKMRQDVKDVKVEVKGKRRKEHPKTFKKINIKYVLTGKIKEKKALEAIQLSLEKYCSVSLMIAKSAKIRAQFEIISPA